MTRHAATLSARETRSALTLTDATAHFVLTPPPRGDTTRQAAVPALSASGRRELAASSAPQASRLSSPALQSARSVSQARRLPQLATPASRAWTVSCRTSTALQAPSRARRARTQGDACRGSAWSVPPAAAALHAISRAHETVARQSATSNVTTARSAQRALLTFFASS